MKMSAYGAPAPSRENSRSRSPSQVRNHYHRFGINLKTGCSKTMAGALEISAIRRLAAVLAADVAGYSRLMGNNEEGTLERLMAHRRAVVDPKIAEHHGRIVKTTGDGILAEFASVVDAVRCAVAMQRRMAERNSGIPIGDRLEFRVGINLADVIVAGDDIYGDGVNVAARVEALADAGGVFVSNTVYDHVRDRLPFVFEDLGEKQVKNIARPVRVYRIPITEIAPVSGGQEFISVAPQTLVSPFSWPSGAGPAAFGPSWQAYPVAQAPATVIVMDDDLTVREALGSLLRSVWACKQICMARCRSS
jgi:class 3 adenylate cyclase